jgi:hypothetical protein
MANICRNNQEYGLNSGRPATLIPTVILSDQRERRIYAFQTYCEVRVVHRSFGRKKRGLRMTIQLE